MKKAPSMTRAAALVLLWPMVAVSAFASHHRAPPSSPRKLHGKAVCPRPGTARGGRRALHRREGTLLHLAVPRGGAAVATAAATKLSQWTSTPGGAFNAALAVLAASTAALKVYGKVEDGGGKDGEGGQTKKDPKVKSLQLRFLAVFWMLRMADWLQGPYFYQVYASKNFGSATSNAMTWVSRLFLTGFASTALFGPLVGRLCDTFGRKAGTLAFSFLYSLGAYSTKSNLLGVLLLGRVMGGIGTSLLFSAPEAWLVGEAGREGVESSLGETFGLAYAGDSIVAILAGQMASVAAAARGPTGPFELSVGFLILGGLMASLMWKENIAGGSSDADGAESGDSSSKPTIRDAVKVVRSDPKIMLVGAMQSLFEAAMYIFVLNWPPAVSRVVGSYFAKFAADSSAAPVSTPYGTVFSCFMACCLLGSTLFSQLTSSNKVDEDGKSKAISTEKFAPGAILSVLMLSLFLFESCVGMYFPAIGTLRSKYFPDSHRSVVMNLFGIPLNAMVVSVFLNIERLGVRGALGVSTTALALATACGLKLKGLVDGERKEGAST
ncbi:hypothetical protein ACHAWF_012301 [Thalassiosira exigua]